MLEYLIAGYKLNKNGKMVLRLSCCICDKIVLQSGWLNHTKSAHHTEAKIPGPYNKTGYVYDCELCKKEKCVCINHCIKCINNSDCLFHKNEKINEIV